MQLRENGDKALDERGRPLSREPRQRPQQHHFAPTTSLGGDAAIGRIFFVLTISGAVIGAVVGTLILRWLMGPGASIPSWLIAVVSSAVLGGFLGFLTSSFTKVFFDALLHASRDSTRR